MSNYQAADLLQSSVELLNEGASLIESGNLREASGVLKSALLISKRCIAEGREQVEDDDYSASSSNDACDVGIDQFMSISTGKGDEPDEWSIHTSASSFYNRPIKITNFPPAPSIQDDFFTMVCSVTVFNLALACHLDAVTNTTICQEEKQSRMSQAMRLYESIFKLQDGSLHQANAFFLMACLNNLGNIHQDLGNTDRAMACFGQLLSILMFLIEQRSICDQETSSACHYEEYFACFFPSISPLIFPNAPIVARAA